MKYLPILAFSLVVFTPIFADDAKDLQGKWQAVKAQIGGQSLPADSVRKMSVTLDGTNYDAQTPNGPDKGTYRIGSESKLKTIDMTGGPESPFKDKTILGVYELSRDTLTICYSFTGKRPTEIKSTEANLFVVITYKKVK